MKKYTVLLLVLIGAFFVITTSVKTQAELGGYDPSRSVSEGYHSLVTNLVRVMLMTTACLIPAITARPRPTPKKSLFSLTEMAPL